MNLSPGFNARITVSQHLCWKAPDQLCKWGGQMASRWRTPWQHLSWWRATRLEATFLTPWSPNTTSGKSICCFPQPVSLFTSHWELRWDAIELPIYLVWLISFCVCLSMCVSHARFQVCERSLWLPRKVRILLCQNSVFLRFDHIFHSAFGGNLAFRQPFIKLPFS